MNIEMPNININNSLVNRVTGLTADISFQHCILGMADSKLQNTLSYLDDTSYDHRFTRQLLGNSNISVVICRPDKSQVVTDAGKIAIISDDPRYSFFVLFNYVGNKLYVRNPNVIHNTAIIAATAFIAEHNVVIGSDTMIESNTTILPDVQIGKRCKIRAGAVIGGEGFEHQRTTRGILSVFHSGKVIIDDDVEVGCNACIDKGLSIDKNTFIGAGTKINNLCHIAHSVKIGIEVKITGLVNISGSSIIEDRVLISPGALIRNSVTVHRDAHIGMGAVVTKDIPAGEVWLGNPAKKLR